MNNAKEFIGQNHELIGRIKYSQQDIEDQIHDYFHPLAGLEEIYDSDILLTLLTVYEYYINYGKVVKLNLLNMSYMNYIFPDLLDNDPIAFMEIYYTRYADTQKNFPLLQKMVQKYPAEKFNDYPDLIDFLKHKLYYESFEDIEDTNMTADVLFDWAELCASIDGMKPQRIKLKTYYGET